VTDTAGRAAANAALIHARAALRPRVGLVLGSGLGGLAAQLEAATAIPYGDLDGFPMPGVSGHQGSLHVGRLGALDCAVLAGRSHYYEHGRADVMRTPLETLRAMGIDTLIATNAAGSLRAEVGPGSVMLIADHINFSGTNPLIGMVGDKKFVGMSEAYDDALRAMARDAAAEAGVALAEGVYMWFSGPSFETPAEIRMARTLGADAVGMSTVPEVILARYLGMRVLAFSVITNLGAGMAAGDLSHEETKAMAPQGGEKLAAILTKLAAMLADEMEREERVG
jgi:purine-nucleoside phosphorylase